MYVKFSGSIKIFSRLQTGNQALDFTVEKTNPTYLKRGETSELQIRVQGNSTTDVSGNSTSTGIQVQFTGL